MSIRGLVGMLKLTVLAMAAAGLVACGSSGGGGGKDETVGKYPEIEIGPAGTCQSSGNPLMIKSCTSVFNQGAVEPGGVLPQEFTILNTGERKLLLEDVKLDYTAPEDAEEPTPAFQLALAADVQAKFDANEDFAIAPKQQGAALGLPELAKITVRFTRYDDGKTRTAVLVLDSDASNATYGIVKIALSVSEGFAKITVNPEFVNFKQVGQGEEKEEKITILNTGTSDLEIKGFKIAGSEYYTLLVQGAEYPVNDTTANPGVTFEESIVIEPSDATYFKVRFAPKDDKPATATLVIFSNDPAKAQGTEVKISGNEAVPCILVNPESVNFGGKKIGEQAVNPLEIVACGESPLEIYSLKIKEGSSPDFSIDAATLDHEPTADNPIIVPLKGKVVVNVVFIPDAENPQVNGVLQLDEGFLVITNNSFEKEKEVKLSGAGVKIECPTAIIKCTEGDEVIPQTVLHLFGDESYAGNGTIQKWEWDVDQPAGSQSVFVPSYTFPNPTFEANVAGVYTFYLTVYDQLNTPSCFPATYEVVVIPDEAIHIELLWHTPEDPDETDTGPEAGSDVDLHFTHPWAAGPDLDGDGDPDGWFHMPFDCFWFNAHPEWGSYDPNIDDNPGLDRDDTDGAGPENINLNIPENVTYKVGIHYWNDHGYGASYTTVRVYIYAQLVFEVADVLLIDSDMWEVCTVEWPSGKVQLTTDAAGQYKITPKYKNPYFMQD